MLCWQELQRPVITGTCRCRWREALCDCISSSHQWVNLPPLHWPVLVDKTTSALLRIWVMAVVSLVFNSFLSSVISLLKLALSPLLCIFFIPTFKGIPKILQIITETAPIQVGARSKTLTKALSMSLRISLMMSALELWAMMASKECFCMDSSSLAGWPSLRTFTLHCVNLSTKLSTATLEGAQHRTCTDVKTTLQHDCNES